MSANEKGVRGKWNRFRRVCSLTARAHHLMWRETGIYMLVVYAGNMLRFCKPYWNIYFSARLLDEILGQKAVNCLIWYTAVLLGGNFLLRLTADLLQNTAEQKRFCFTQQERMIFSEKILGMDYVQLEDERIHTLFRRVERETFNDGQNLETLRRSMPVLAGDLAAMLLSAAMVWEFVRKMAEYRVWIPIFFLFVAAGIWVSARCNAAGARLWEECGNRISENCLQRDGYTRYFEQYERGKEIRIYRLEKLMIGKLMETHHFNDRALDERNRKGIPYSTVSILSGESANILMYCLTAAAALNGIITVGGMLQYVQSISLFVKHISRIWNILVRIWYNADYLERYFKFLDMPGEMRRGCIPVEKRVDGEYKVVFEHVSFRYPGSESYALKDITMEFRIGEKLAVVGMNGSGKSTFIKLLCRLYDPTEGCIYMNGIDIRRYEYQEYLSLFSVVFQDFKLFSFSLGENIAVSEDYRENEVKEAMKRTGMQEFLKEQKNGLETTLYRDFDKEGVELSGGEAQKIALARAVCKGAPFVLLDEPTAALDPLAEYEIYRRFNELVADRTTVYISHRMSSCRFCGDIAVFHEGRLIQRGSHEELMKDKQGKYCELWTAQAQYYQEKGIEAEALCSS